MQNILITGATGLVGAHLVEAARRAYPASRIVTVVQSLDPHSYYAQSQAAGSVVSYPGDLRNRELVRDVVYQEEIDTIFHLAAQPIVNVAKENPAETWTANLLGTLNVLEACRQNSRIKSVVVASSDKAYGDPLFQPYTEIHPLNALHPYDSSKACQDMMTRSYARCYGVPAVVTRFGNIFGPGDLHWNRLIPGLMRSIARREEFLVRSDGKATRDFVYVRDVANAYLAIGMRASEFVGEALNITSKTHLSVLGLIEQVQEALGMRVPVRILNEAKHEIQTQRVSDDRFRSLFPGFRDTPFQEAILQTWEWYKSRENPRV